MRRELKKHLGKKILLTVDGEQITGTLTKVTWTIITLTDVTTPYKNSELALPGTFILPIPTGPVRVVNNK